MNRYDYLAHFLLMALAALLIWFAWPRPAEAASVDQCGPVLQILTNLFVGHQEVPVFRGDDIRGSQLIVTTAPSGSWTILRLLPSGLACFVGAGHHHTVGVPS